MRDPGLVARAQRAAPRLESAWERWRALQGLAETPARPVVGYMGYALTEPCRRGGGDHGAADRALEISRRHIPGRSFAQIFAVAPAIKPDILAVTSQLSGSQLGHSFLPGRGARLRNTRAG